jgi:hypothetical protein
MTTKIDPGDDPMLDKRWQLDDEGWKLYWELFSAGFPRPNERDRRIQMRPVPRAPVKTLRELFAQPLPTPAEMLVEIRATDGDGCADRLEAIYLREGVPARELLLPQVQQALRLLARATSRVVPTEVISVPR